MNNRNLGIALAVLLLPCFSVAKTETVDGVNWTYEVYNGGAFGEASVFSVPTQTSGAISIPTTLGGYPVTSIGDDTFRGCYGLTSITIPNSVRLIGDRAFWGCSNLTSIAIPNGVTRIGDRAFCDCSSLTSITIPPSVNSVGRDLLATDNPKPLEVHISDLAAWCEISFDGELTIWGETWSLYMNGETITNVVIPDGVTSIGDYAFQRCRSMKTVAIPDSVTSIGQDAFSRCSGLTSVTIPNGITLIGDRAFLYCSGLTSVTIPNSVTNFGSAVFSGCPNLRSITIPAAVLPDGVKMSLQFYDSYQSITNVVLLPGVTSIGEDAFSGCSGLKSITIPNSVTKIGSDAFNECTALSEVHISDLAAWCGIVFRFGKSNPLRYAHHLYLNGEEATDIVIPEGVTWIGGYSFYACSGLTSVTIPNSVTSIGTDAFYACSGLTEAVIGNGVTQIGSQAFSDCSGLTSVTIPNGVTSIGAGAFSDCSGLTSVTIPNSVTDIGDVAFSRCSGLTEAVIGNGVTQIGSQAFSGCSNLTSVTISDSVTTIMTEFPDCVAETRINVSDASKWATNTINASLKGIRRLFDRGNELTSVVIPEGVSRIEKFAYACCSNLTSISLPNSVTSIGAEAFYGCAGLSCTLALPDGVTSIGNYAFYGCSGLSGPLTLPNSMTNIGISAFYDCSGLTSVTIPDGVRSIGREAFCRCLGLPSVTIPNSVTDIGRDAFLWCGRMEMVFAPEALAERWDCWPFSCRVVAGIDVPVESVRIPKEWIYRRAPSALAAANEDWAVAARATAANGANKVWECFVAGLDPSDPEKRFLSEIFLDENGNPVVCWTPDLGSVRDYAVEGKASLEDEWGMPDGESRFFRVCVAMPGGFGDQTVSFDSAGGSPVAPITAAVGAALTPPAVPTREGYTFAGWSPPLPTTMPLHAATFTAQWAMHYALSFDSAGGSAVPPIMAAAGAALIEPEAPTKTGYAFAGWSPGFPATMPEGGATLVAQWTADPDYFDWTLSGNAVTITGVKGLPKPQGSLELPAEINGYPVTGIGRGAFDARFALTSITIPSSVTSIGDGAFSSCTSLVSFVVSGDNAVYSSQNGLLLSKDGELLLSVPAGVETVAIPTGVTSIGDAAFAGCYGLTSITIPDGVTSIGSYTFYGCTGLTEVVIGNGVTSIGDGSFGMCSELTSITIPSSVTNIGKTAFSFCSNLASITIPTSVTSIGNGTFSGCTALTSITLPDSVTTIGSSAFDHCGLTSIRIPDYVTSVGDICFAMCPSLSSVSIPYQLRNQTSNWSLPSGCQIDVRSPVYGTISFDSAGGSSVPSISSPFGTSLTEPAAPTRSGYTFAGWSPAFPATMPAGLVKLTAQWTPRNYTITFDSAGGSAVSSITAAFGSALTAPAAPTRSGYMFAGWSPAFPATMPLNGATLTAQWTRLYTITFDSAGGSEVASITAAYGSALTEPAAPTRSGYMFTGWSPAFPATMPLNGATLTAQWTRLYTITFDSAGGSAVASITAVYGSTLTEPAVPTRSGYTFTGWSPAFPATMPEGGAALTAQWAKNYTITFDSTGGSAIAPITAACGSALTAPAVPTKTGYTFVGWSPAFPATMPEGGATLTAQWTPRNYTITFDSAGGSAVASITAAYGSALTAPAAPSLNGFDFAGWSPAFPSTMPLGGATLVAQWTPRNYTITFDSAGGTAVAPITAACGSSLTAPESPTKEGFTFAGWLPAFPATMPFGGATLVAQWTSIDIANLDWTVSGDAVTITGVKEKPTGALVVPSEIEGHPVTAIGNNAFQNCYGLTSVMIPASVTSIGSSAFSGCYDLASVAIPDGVATIGTSAFYACSALTSVTIPDSVTSIGSKAFGHCGLTAINVGSGNLAYSSNNGLLLSKDGTTVLQGVNGSVTIPDGVTSIENDAFYYCSRLTSITIPNGVTSIGNSAFSACSALKSVAIPGSVTSIGSFAFGSCYDLESVSIQAGVASIGSSAFGYCSALRSIEIPSSVTSIGINAFKSCSGLKHVVVPGDFKLSTLFPDAYEAITNAVVASGSTNVVAEAFRNCGELSSIMIADGVTSIGDYAFYGCSRLTVITIPDSVTSIGDYAFRGCSRLKAITIPDDVTSIGSYAFTSCYSLETISIPASLQGQTSNWGLPSACQIIVRN